MFKDLGIKSTGATSFVKRYMNPTKLYKKSMSFIMLMNLKEILLLIKKILILCD